MASSPNNSYLPTNDGRGNTFDRGLVAFIKNRLPYNFSIFDTEEAKNPKYKYFEKAGIRRAEALARHSIAISNEFNNTPYGALDKDTTFQDLMYATANTDKFGRLKDYRTMGAFSDVSDALDEICNELINEDDEGDIAKLHFRNISLESKDKKTILDEFEKYINFYDLKNKGANYVRQFLIEGELFFEQIIHEEHVEEGVLGILNMPTELTDPVYNNIQNMIVKGYLYKKPIFDPNNPMRVMKYDFIPFNENQIVYVNSGMYNETKDFVVPFLENARRPYRQLSLIEDAIVIYRLVRAPERLVFNVDTGTLPPPKAEAYLKQLIQKYWSSRTFDIDQKDVVKKFNPQSMLDSFWFAKRAGSEGTSVTQLAGGQNLGQLEDLHFFLKKLYRSLKVPSTRLDPEDAFRDGAEILREELKFAQFVITQQQRFAAAIKKGFISHLKFKNMFKKHDLTETNLEIIFNPPTNFYEMRESQRLELKANNFNTLASSEFISKTYAQKKYLKWDDQDILANREFLRKDAELQYELAQIANAGPNWKDAMVAQASGIASAAASTAGSAGGGGIPPEFGGGPAAVGETPIEGAPEGELPPEGGAPAETPPPV